MQKAALYFSGLFFAAMAILHVVRLIGRFEIVVSETAIPLWGSLPGALVATALAAWMLFAAR
ncbi:MAG: hypothetical protein ACR2PA_00765, partial [Hyphomicrobiaceae bacterium]